MREWSDIRHSLAKKLLETAETDSKKLELRSELFKSYHVTLFNENILVRKEKSGTFHEDFFNGKNI